MVNKAKSRVANRISTLSSTSPLRPEGSQIQSHPDSFCLITITVMLRLDFRGQTRHCWIIPLNCIQNPASALPGGHFLRRILFFEEDMESTRIEPVSREMVNCLLLTRHSHSLFR